MAARGEGSGSSTFMAFMLGGLAVAVVVLGYFMFAGDGGGASAPDEVNIKIEKPATDSGS